MSERDEMKNVMENDIKRVSMSLKTDVTDLCSIRPFYRRIPLSIDRYLNPFVWFQFHLNNRRECTF